MISQQNVEIAELSESEQNNQSMVSSSMLQNEINQGKISIRKSPFYQKQRSKPAQFKKISVAGGNRTSGVMSPSRSSVYNSGGDDPNNQS